MSQQERTTLLDEHGAAHRLEEGGGDIVNMDPERRKEYILERGTSFIFNNKEVHEIYGQDLVRYQDSATKEPSGMFSTTLNVSKAMLNSTYMWNGIVLNSILVVGVMLMTYLSSRLLIKSSDKRGTMTYEATARECLSHRWAMVADVLIITRLFFAMSAEIIIVRDVLQSVFPEHYIIITFVYSLIIMMGLSMVPRIDLLKYSSFLSLACMIFFGIGVAIEFDHISPIDWSVVKYWSFDVIAMVRALPILVFIFAAHPLEMKDPKFNSFSRSLLTSMNVVALILSEIGILGYLTFGSSTKGNLINNYDSGSLLSDFMRVFVLMNVTFTYPLVCRPLVVASEYMLYNGKLMSWMTCGAAGNDHKDDDKPWSSRKRNITIISFFAAFALSLCIKNMSFLLGVSGSIGSAGLGFIIPAFINFKVKPFPSQKRWVATIITIAFGCIVGVFGLIVTLYYGQEH